MSNADDAGAPGTGEMPRASADVQETFDAAMGTTGQTDWVRTEPNGTVVLGLTVGADGSFLAQRGTGDAQAVQPPTRLLVYIYPDRDGSGHRVQIQAYDTRSDRMILGGSSEDRSGATVEEATEEAFDDFLTKDTPGGTRRFDNGMPVERRWIDEDLLTPRAPPIDPDGPKPAPVPISTAVDGSGSGGLPFGLSPLVLTIIGAVLVLGVGAFFLFGGGDDPPADGGGVPAAPTDAPAGTPVANAGGAAVDPDRPADGEASGPTRAEAPVPGGISPDLLGTFIFIGDGVVEFAYEGDRIVGRVVQPARNTGLNLWGQLSLCSGGGLTEGDLVGEVNFDLDATGKGRWFWFELVTGNGFRTCVRDDAGLEVSVIFTESRANATGLSPTGATNIHAMLRGAVDTPDLTAFDASAIEPEGAVDVQDSTGSFACIATDLRADTPDFDAAPIANIVDLWFEGLATNPPAGFGPGGILRVNLDRPAIDDLPPGWIVEYSLVVHFGNLRESLPPGVTEQGMGTPIGAAEWTWRYTGLPDVGANQTAVPQGLGEMVPEGTATVMSGVLGFEIPISALPTLASANSFAVDMVMMLQSPDGVVTTCRDSAIVNEIR